MNMQNEPRGMRTDGQGRELARHGTALFPVACYEIDLEKTPVSWHWHAEWEAIAVTRGAAAVAVGKQRFTLRQGEGVFIHSGVLHAVWAREGGCRLRSAVFLPRLVAGGCDSVFWHDYVQPLLRGGARQYLLLDGGAPWHAQALNAVGAAWAACDAHTPGYEFEVRGALSRLVFLLTHHSAAAPKPPSEKALREEERLKQMLRFIEENYASELTAAEIARSARVSESECLRCFRGTIGAPPSQYLKQLRVRKAAQLLAAGACGVAEAGARCGFSDASYFSKTFRETMGCTPSRFRQESAGAAPQT